MEVKWSEVMKAADEVGFTNEEYGLVYINSPLDGSIGVEEYAIGETLKKLLEKIGVNVEVDVTFKSK
jgi:hypothetical protein